jgi:hypothetical protein
LAAEIREQSRAGQVIDWVTIKLLLCVGGGCYFRAIAIEKCFIRAKNKQSVSSGLKINKVLYVL